MREKTARTVGHEECMETSIQCSGSFLKDIIGMPGGKGNWLTHFTCIKKEVEQDYKPSKPCPWDVLPPARLHLLNVTLPPPNSTTKDQVFKCRSLL